MGYLCVHAASGALQINETSSCDLAQFVRTQTAVWFHAYYNMRACMTRNSVWAKQRGIGGLGTIENQLAGYRLGQL